MSARNETGFPEAVPPPICEERYCEVDATWDCTIMVWPDGVWCFEDDYEETQQGKSDDFATLRLAADDTCFGETIEEIVEKHLQYSSLQEEDKNVGQE